MNKLKQIEALVEEAIEKIEKAGLKGFRNFKKQILMDLSEQAYNLGQREPKPLQLEVGKSYRSREGNKITIEYLRSTTDHYPFVGDNGNYYHRNGSWINGVNQHCDLISEWQEEVKPELNHQSKYYPLWKYMKDEHGVTLLETDCQEIERFLPQQLQPLPDKMPDWFLPITREIGGVSTYTYDFRLQEWNKFKQHFGTPSNNLQPLPDQMPEWFGSYFQGHESFALACYSVCKTVFGNEKPREWWMDLQKGDKFMYGKEIRVFLGYIAIVDEHHRNFNVNDCSPYTDPEEELIKTFTPEQKKLWEMMKEGKV